MIVTSIILSIFRFSIHEFGQSFLWTSTNVRSVVTMNGQDVELSFFALS